MTPAFRIAAIAGDGIGKEVLPEGLRVMKAAAERFGFELEIRDDRVGQLRLVRAARPDDAGRLEAAARRLRRDLLRRRRLAGHGGRQRLAVGLAAQVPPRVRPVHQPAAGAPVRRRAVSAGRSQARRHRLLRGAREHRGRVHQPRRRDVRGHRARDRDPGVGVLALRHRPRAALRLRAGELAPAQEPDRGDQEQRHRDQHAVVGRPRRRGRQGLSRREGRQAAHRHPQRPLRAAAAALRRGGREQPVRRHPVRPRAGDHRHHRPGAEREPQPRAQVPVAVRAGARLGAGHLRPAHRQPDRDDLVGRADARLPDPGAGCRPRGARRDREGDRARHRPRPAHARPGRASPYRRRRPGHRRPLEKGH